MYSWLSTAASALGAPHARRLALQAIRLVAAIAPATTPAHLERKVMGLTFPSPVGLAAGFDKHGELYPSLPSLGFGFAEIGSVIPRPEPHRSRGLDAVIAILSQYPHPHPIPLGVSVSMNRKTPTEQIADDYQTCLERLWKYADYFVINLGVRAGPDLHMAEFSSTLHKVLSTAQSAQTSLSQISGLHRPLAVKIDRNRGETKSLLACMQEFAVDGLILSGDVKPGEERYALDGLEQALKILDARMPLISVGGIRSPSDAMDRLSAGADLVQLYSGIVESGPLLPRRINEQQSKLRDS